MTATSTPLNRPVRRRRRGLIGWAFIAPFAAVFIFATVLPLGYSFVLSLFQERMIGGVSFVGFENYVQQLTDPDFWSAVGRVGVFVAIQAPLMMALALLAALALDSARLHAPAVFRLGIFLPYAVPGVVATLLWGYIYGSKFGLVGDLNEMFGWSLANPLSSALILPSISNIGLWLYVGYNMLVFYAALRVIPTELYEAATIDGAGAWRIMFSIKLPAIWPAIIVAATFSIIGGFQLFNEPNILRALVPNVISSDFTPNMYAYTLSFAGGQYNAAAAVALIMGAITAVVAFLVQRRGFRRDI
ncbi:carbohydrate ABC transporter permease [Agromyces aureus]|uniref:Sugar ABC transporter permease n=1 Tax=Agromyces aureus TaxID=453304 RepID=A0A191WIV2_9MICO|nr:sugar ABC transporter permease [Agromyces aureus]ANJ28142.1 sugar ABC transporter permease [Agromyces aureus]